MNFFHTKLHSKWLMWKYDRLLLIFFLLFVTVLLMGCNFQR